MRRLGSNYPSWRKAGIWDRLMDAIVKAHDGKVRETLRPIGSIAGVERDGVAHLVHLHAVAVELYLVTPAFPFGQAVLIGPRRVVRLEC